MISLRSLLFPAAVVLAATPALLAQQLSSLRPEVLPNTAVETTGVGPTFSVPNADGSADFIQFYYPSYQGLGDVFITDLGTGESHWMKLDNKQERMIFHLANGVLAPNGKLFISGLVSGGGRPGLRHLICVYDPAKNELDLHAVRTPDTLLGEMHPITLGPDGLIYCAGTDPQGASTAVSINPDTMEVIDYGRIGTPPSKDEFKETGVYSMAVDSRYIYLARGKVPWLLLAFDRETRTTKTLAEVPTPDKGNPIGVTNVPGGCSARIRTPESKYYYLHEGELVESEPNATPPWPQPEATPQPSGPAFSTVDLLPNADGEATLWWRPSSRETPWRLSSRHGREPRIKHRDNMENEGWTALRLEVPGYAIPLAQGRELPDGRIFAVSNHSHGSVIYDPQTDTVKKFGKMPGSLYALVATGNKLYLGGYPNAVVMEYDLTQPWTLGKESPAGVPLEATSPDSNPRQVGRLRDSGAHKLYAAVVGSDGKIYFGGRRMRDGNIGGFGWYNPADDSNGGLWKEISNYQVNYLAAAGDEVVISARRVDDPILNKPKPEQGALFFFDTKTSKIVDTLEPFPGVRGPGPIVYAPNGMLIGWCNDANDPKRSHLYAVDVATRKVVNSRHLSEPLPTPIGGNQRDAWDFRLGPDGKIWTFMGKNLVRIDPETLVEEPVGQMEGPGGKMAFSGSDLYLIGGDYIRKLSGVIAP